MTHTHKKTLENSKDMEARIVKRRRVENDEWPLFFEINALAKLVFDYVHPMQIRKWMQSCSGYQQLQICMWMPKQYFDTHIQMAICHADNVLCASFLNVGNIDWTSALQHPMPNLLLHFVTVMPINFSVLCLTNIPVANLQVLVNHQQWESSWNANLVWSHVNTYKRDDAALIWMLNEQHWTAEIGDALKDKFKPEIWCVIEPHIVSKQLTMNKVDNYYLASMPIDALRVVPKDVYEAKKIGLLAIDCNNWSVVDWLWSNDFQATLESKLDCSFDVKIEPEFLLSNVVDDSEFNCIRDYRSEMEFHDDEESTEMEHFDSALQYFCGVESLGNDCLSSNMTLKDAIRSFAYVHLLRRPEEQLWIFERACLLGRVHIVRFIWNNSSQQQQPILITKLGQSRFCTNKDMLQFAWPLIHDKIVPLQWIRAAFNTSNTMLWSFLKDKGLISTELLLGQEFVLASVAYIVQKCKPKNVIEWLGVKCVAMLAAVWDLPGFQTETNIEAIFRVALVCNNRPLLRFLNDHNVPLRNDLIMGHIVLFSFLQSTNILSQVKEQLPPQNISYLHNDDGPKVWNVLLNIVPIQNIIAFYSTPSFELCVFLLDKGVLSNQTLIDTLRNQPFDSKLLLDKLRVHMCCDANEL